MEKGREKKGKERRNDFKTNFPLIPPASLNNEHLATESFKYGAQTSMSLHCFVEPLKSVGGRVELI